MARRLLLTYLTLTALTLAVVVVPLGQIFANRERDRLTFDIERDAQNIASLVEDHLEMGIDPQIDEVAKSYRDLGGRILVVDKAGLGVVDSDHLGEEHRDFATRPEIVAALDGDRTSGTRNSETLNAKLIYVAVPVASGGVVHGAVRLTYPMSTLDKRISDTWRKLGVLSGVVLVVVAIVGLVFARSITKPLLELEEVAKALATGDLESRTQVSTGGRELESLAAAFNTMAAALQQQLEVQRRFVSDASHQLRTPLTALRLQLEILATRVDPVLVPKLEAAIDETDRLGALVSSLLSLARGDASFGKLEPLNLPLVIQERVEFWEPLASERNVSLNIEIFSTAQVRAVTGAVEQILDNLISNALNAITNGGNIFVRTRESGDMVQMQVSDDGPGMSEAMRQQAFKRFWRGGVSADQSDRGGFGLGLSIVEMLVTACGGTVAISAGDNDLGTAVTVEFLKS